MSASIAQGPPGAFANLAAATLTLALRFIGIFFAVLSWVFFVVSALPYLVLALALSIAMIPWVEYHDQIIENVSLFFKMLQTRRRVLTLLVLQVEFGMRCRIEPFYYTWPRQLIILMRLLYDPLVCW